MKKTPFMKFHWVLVAMYVTTFLLGLSIRYIGSIRNIHPYFGMGVVVVPALFYILSKKKKAIRIMLRSNFLKAPDWLMLTARITTLLMMLHILVMVTSGFILFWDLSPNPTVYITVLRVHRSAIIILPLLAVVHAISRLLWRNRNQKHL